MRVGLLHSLIRKDEKLLIAELRGRSDVELVFLNDRKLAFDFRTIPDVDVVLERCINHSRAMHALRLFEGGGLDCVNRYEVSRLIGRILVGGDRSQIVGGTAGRISIQTSLPGLLDEGAAIGRSARNYPEGTQLRFIERRAFVG